MKLIALLTTWLLATAGLHTNAWRDGRYTGEVLCVRR